MALLAYLDDSTDDDSPYYVLAGYLSTREKWENFVARWQELLPLAVMQDDGRYRFKMSEMSLYNRLDNIAAFHTTINEHVERSIAIILDKDLLKDVVHSLEAYVIDNHGRHSPLDVRHLQGVWSDPFFTAYYLLIDNFLKMISRNRDFGIIEPIDFHFDETSRKSALRDGWHTFVKHLPDECRPYVGIEPKFEDDEVALPLQAADFRAWWLHRWANEHGVADIADGRYPFKTAAKPINNLVLHTDEKGLVEFMTANFYGSIINSDLNFMHPSGHPRRVTFDPESPSLVIRRR